MFTVVPFHFTPSRSARRGKAQPVTPLASATTLHKIASRGADDYLRLSSEASARADELSNARQVTTSDGVSVTWESPQALRHWGSEQQNAQECLELAGAFMAIGSRANQRQYQHRCYVMARHENTKHDDTTSVIDHDADTLDAAALRAGHADDPPPLMTLVSSPIATGAASNAPGGRVLSPATRYAPRIDQRRTSATNTRETDTG
jgi:hypothetical protein